MTERLSTLLHEGAEQIAVPPPSAAEILSRGRSLHGRRRITSIGAGVAAALVLVGGTALLVPDRAPEDRDSLGILAPAVPIDPDGWAVAQGSTIHLGSGTTSTVTGKVKAMYYTSAGVMVRTGRTAYTEGDRTSNYFVLAGDGTVRDFALDLGDLKPGTDPTLPYLAYSVKGDDSKHWELLLRDVRTGKVATRVPYEGAFTWGGWNAPPVALSGDYAYVGIDDATLAINWRTGAVKTAKGLLPSRMPTVAGGRELVDPRNDEQGGVRELESDDAVTESYTVLDAVTGERVGGFDITGTVLSTPWPQLAPDGQHVLLTPMAMCNEDNECHYEDPSTTVLDVETGASRRFTIGDGTFGWSPDGRLLLVTGTEVTSCDADTGECRTTPVKIDGTGPIRVSGNDNES
ncbi:hypothetical protein [Nocardioides cavernaquae]|uniref:WD40 repeat domain-containing protein n=1 Tax=Nocardioides cavernaquae TaxID=2321396 RepID=A0A3A5H308_9ACTN|nr:hypothetical protein [Nocardioides cavernaquae]RJS45052.1 hypothetical protein D4739_01520 [Nocardioides cavernaquae]